MRLLALGLLSMWRFSRAFRIVRVSSSVSVATRRQYPSLLPFDSSTSSRSFAAQATKHADESTLLHNSMDVSNDSYQDFCRLAEEIRRHDELYYGGGEVELTDDEYDALVAQEAQYCQDHPDDLLRYQLESGLGIQATRYGGRVGSISATTIQQQEEDSGRQAHLTSMLSLSNVNSTPQLLQWLERIRVKILNEYEDTITEIGIITEPKLDGLSLSLRYEKSDGTK